jgi:phage terminase large subunit-like protein
MMTLLDMKNLLIKISIVDNRVLAVETVREWHSILGELFLDECIEAVNLHRQESTEYLQPAHIKTLVRRIRSGRAQEREHEARELEEYYRKGRVAPKPDNFDAMSAAWNDPIQFAKEVAIYDEQLKAAGFEPVPMGPYGRDYSK